MSIAGPAERTCGTVPTRRLPRIWMAGVLTAVPTTGVLTAVPTTGVLTVVPAVRIGEAPAEARTC